MSKLSEGNEAVLDLIRTERMRQDRKWGEQNHNDYYWLGILTEELGEAAKALIEGAITAYAPEDFPDKNVKCHYVRQRNDTAALEKELVQVAAVAVAWLEAIRRRAGGG